MEDKYFIVYVLRSELDGKNYAGFTANLEKRIQAHFNGEVISTASRRPLRLIYFEACLNEFDAKKREKYFKTHRIVEKFLIPCTTYRNQFPCMYQIGNYF